MPWVAEDSYSLRGWDLGAGGSWACVEPLGVPRGPRGCTPWPRGQAHSSLLSSVPSGQSVQA